MLVHNIMFNIFKIAPRIVKRARVSGVAGITLLITALFTSNIYAQNTGNPSQLRVKVDANNYLILTAAAQTAPVSSPTVFTNIRLKTDSSNQLYVVVTGNITPTTITCSSSIGTSLSVLQGGNPCSWTATPTVTQLNAKIASRGTYGLTVKDTNGSDRFEVYIGGGGNGNMYMFDGSANQWAAFGASEGLNFGTATTATGYIYITRIEGGGPNYNQIQLFPTNGAYSGFATLATQQLYGWKFLVNEANTVKIPLTLNTNGSLLFAGNTTFSTDNSFDIGASGATRPRTGYFGTSVISPLYVAGSTSGVSGTCDSVTVTGGIVTTCAGSGGILTGVTGSISGAVTIGTCDSGTASITGARNTMAVSIAPTTYPGDGVVWYGYVSTNDVVTVKVCGLSALSPTATTFQVRVLP